MEKIQRNRTIFVVVLSLVLISLLLNCMFFVGIDMERLKRFFMMNKMNSNGNQTSFDMEFNDVSIYLDNSSEYSNPYPFRSKDCNEHYTSKMFDIARKSETNLCSDNSEYIKCTSSVFKTCELSNIAFNSNKKWQIPCKLKSRKAGYFPKYRYKTGPMTRFLPYIDSKNTKEYNKCSDYINETTILTVGECSANIYHAFVEYFDWYLLRHYYNISDGNRNIRLLMTCNGNNMYPNAFSKIYYNIMSQYKIIPFNTLKPNTCFRRIIFGKNNIGWYKFWEPIQHCHSCDLVLSFRSYWMQAFNLAILQQNNTEPIIKSDNKYHFCWFERYKHTRSWSGHKQYFDNIIKNISQLDEYKSIFTNVKFDIITPGYLEYKTGIQQYNALRQCNILSGTHGAGFILNIFIKQPGIIIYIKPFHNNKLNWNDCQPNKSCYNDGFINFAKMVGHTIFIVNSKLNSNENLIQHRLHHVNTHDLTQKIINAIQIIKVSR